jgi:hypothetical protein
MTTPQKVGVLTFHRCINYGSYWQARAVVEGLRQAGHDAVLLDHHSARVNRAEWRNAFQPTLPRRTARSDYASYAVKTRKFFEAFAQLPLSLPFKLEDPAGMERCDAVVVGSDEVWNLRHPWYAACPLFFGEGVKSEHLVSYAASFGCHDADEPLDERWAEPLRRFAALAVRDDNSRRLLAASLGSEPELVLDPCLQFDGVCRREGEACADTAVVYGHGFSADFAGAVRDWAERRSVRLVSIGYRNDWADAQWLSAGPEEFASAMGAARAVVTNFFHGCVFALLNEKPFVCTPTEYRRNKLSALIGSVAAEERMIDGPAHGAAVAAALDEAPNGQTRARLLALRLRSAAYLAHALA